MQPNDANTASIVPELGTLHPITDVLGRLGIPVSTGYRLMQQGKFAKTLKVGGKRYRTSTPRFCK